MKESKSISDFGNKVIMVVNQIKCYGEKMEYIYVIENIPYSLIINFDFVVCVIQESKDLESMIVNQLIERFKRRCEEPLEQVLNVKASLKENGGIISQRGCGRGCGRGSKCRRGRGRGGLGDHNNFDNNERNHQPTRGHGKGRGRGNCGRINEKKYDKSNVECYNCHKE
ncbi:hypothetical protein CR513_57042, partial [Mucuna pruriens]